MIDLNPYPSEMPGAVGSYQGHVNGTTISSIALLSSTPSTGLIGPGLLAA
jgi:hypothetical protein